MERFPVPDSLYHNDQMENQELFLAGSNNGPPFLLSNELTKEHKHVLTLFPVHIEPLGLAKSSFPITVWSKGYFNIQYPSIYYNWPNDDWMKLCFWNPVTSSIYLFKFTAGKTEGFELYERSFQGSYVPKMQVMGLRLAGNNKLYVFARTRKPGNTTKAVMQKLVLQW